MGLCYSTCLAVIRHQKKEEKEEEGGGRGKSTADLNLMSGLQYCLP
jgi:hypothetical protein